MCQEEPGKLQWSHGSDLPPLPNMLTCQSIFSLCWKLTGYLPVCGWLQVTTAIIKRHASFVMTGWDDEVRDPLLTRMLMGIITRLAEKDPAHVDWCFDGREVTVWVDASSLATGVIVESSESLAAIRT